MSKMRVFIGVSLASAVAAISTISFDQLRFHKGLMNNSLHFTLNQDGFEALGDQLVREPDTQNAHYCPYENCTVGPDNVKPAIKEKQKAIDQRFAPLLAGLNYPGPVFFQRTSRDTVFIPNVESYSRDNYGVFAEWEFWPEGVPPLIPCDRQSIQNPKEECGEQMNERWSLSYVWYDVTTPLEN